MHFALFRLRTNQRIWCHLYGAAGRDGAVVVPAGPMDHPRDGTHIQILHHNCTIIIQDCVVSLGCVVMAPLAGGWVYKDAYPSANKMIVRERIDLSPPGGSHAQVRHIVCSAAFYARGPSAGSFEKVRILRTPLV